MKRKYDEVTVVTGMSPAWLLQPLKVKGRGIDLA
jgi:hypothetical protein